MKRAVMIKKGIGILFCLPFVIVLALCFICTARNNKLLESFSDQLYHYELPAETEIVETKSLCGNLAGKNNSMDYAAAMLIKTKQSESKIKSYYFNIDFEGVEESMIRPAVEIIKLEDSQLDPYYIKNQSIHFSNISEDEAEGDYMVIIITDIGHQSLFDLRSRAD